MPSFGAISELPISALPVVSSGASITGTVATSQAQTASGTAQLGHQGTGSTAQAQTSAGTGVVTTAVAITGTGATSQAQTSAGEGVVTSSSATPAGKRHKPILIDARGQIHEFATQEGANAFLKSLEPVEEKQIQAKAKRIVSAVVRTGSAFKPTELTPVKVISGPPELTALANMRAAILQGQLNALVNAQIQAEMQRQEDDELAAVAVMMMME